MPGVAASFLETQSQSQLNIEVGHRRDVHWRANVSRDSSVFVAFGGYDLRDRAASGKAPPETSN
jgi:hypothetical protein